MQLDGVLFFPITPFTEGRLDTALLARHIESGLAHDPGAVFVACGTGEMHALSSLEHHDAVSAAVRVAGGTVPICAGAGGPLPAAIRHAERAEAAGADALLLLPPYLVNAPARGIVEYVRAVAEATPLPVIVYQRGQVRFSAETAVEVAGLPNVVGFKDGLGDMELMHQIVLAVRESAGPDFMFFNGLPTAELTVPAYRGIGVPLYSSAVFCFAPEIAKAFYHAVEKGDTAARDRLLKGFYVPLVRLRGKVPGYAVSLVKAGVRLRGLDVGPVRAPLVEPDAEDIAALGSLIDDGLALVGADH